MNQTTPLRKRFSYRLNVRTDNEADVVNSLAEVWNGVTWRTGPVIVAWVSHIYGTCQIWAVSEAEGRRVIAIALNHMKAKVEDGRWIITRSRSAAKGKVRLVRATVVSARARSHGCAPHRWLS
jgi:hypothetical protein